MTNFADRDRRGQVPRARNRSAAKGMGLTRADVHGDGCALGEGLRQPGRATAALVQTYRALCEESAALGAQHHALAKQHDAKTAELDAAASQFDELMRRLGVLGKEDGGRASR